MLKTRILTAIVMMALLLVVLFWMPKGAAIGFFAALVLAGAWEWTAFAGIEEQHWKLSHGHRRPVCLGLGPHGSS